LGGGDNRHFGGVMVNMHTPSAVERGFRKKEKKKVFIKNFSSSQSVKVFIEGYPTS
jgi:hypothetical protein